jgi:SAM-dependent methyltransferase
MTQPTNLQAEINQYWNQQAAKLGADGAPHHNIRDDARRRVWLDALRPLLPPPAADILDVGTGTGFQALLLAELGHRVTGIDLSEGMLADGRGIAAERARAGAAAYPPIFKIGDAMNPLLEPANVDVVSNRTSSGPCSIRRKRLANGSGCYGPGDASWQCITGACEPGRRTRTRCARHFSKSQHLGRGSRATTHSSPKCWSDGSPKWASRTSSQRTWWTSIASRRSRAAITWAGWRSRP